MHKNVEMKKQSLLNAIKEDQKLKRLAHRGYPLEKFHYHEMSPNELKEFRKEYDSLIDRLYPQQ